MVFLKLIVWLCIAIVSIVVGGYFIISIGGWMFVGFIATSDLAYKIGFGIVLFLVGLGVVLYVKLLFGILLNIIKPRVKQYNQ